MKNMARNFYLREATDDYKARAKKGDIFCSEDERSNIYAEEANVPQVRFGNKYPFIAKLDMKNKKAICHNGKARPGLRCFLGRRPNIGEFIKIIIAEEDRFYVFGKIIKIEET